jgi:hypothetical protein
MACWWSSGTTNVAGLRGNALVTAIASAVSRAMSAAVAQVRTQPDTGRASEWMSLVSGAS